MSIRQRVWRQDRHVAYVVASQRIAGKPRQRILGYVGSITCTPDDGERVDFWEKAMDRLLAMNRAGTLTEDQCVALIEQVEATVPSLPLCHSGPCRGVNGGRCGGELGGSATS